MNRKVSIASWFCTLSLLGWSALAPEQVTGQCLDCTPGFSPAFQDYYSAFGPNGEGYSIYRGSNGTFGTTNLGPYRTQQYVDLSNVPVYYGPMNNRYMLQSPTIWQRYGANDSRLNRESASAVSANPTMNPSNKSSDRIPMNQKAEKKGKKNLVSGEPEKAAAEKPVPPKPKPTPLVMDADDRVPAWLVSATDFIDRFVKAGDVVDALNACQRLIETRSGLPSDIYTRAAILSFLDGRDLDEVGSYVMLGTSDGQRLTSRNLPGGSLEKYLSPSERRRFVETVSHLRAKAVDGLMTEEHKRIVEALLDL